MKHEAHGTQQPRHINAIGEGASTAQRSDSLVQSINQRFLKESRVLSAQGTARYRAMTGIMALCPSEKQGTEDAQVLVRLFTDESLA